MGVKVWYMANSIFKFESNFEVYCRKSQVLEGDKLIAWREFHLVHNVVLHLLDGYNKKGHVVRGSSKLL